MTDRSDSFVNPYPKAAVTAARLVSTPIGASIENAQQAPSWFKTYQDEIHGRLKSLEESVNRNTLSIADAKQQQQYDRESMTVHSETMGRVAGIIDGMAVMDRVFTGFVDRIQKVAIVGALFVGGFVAVDRSFDWLARQLTRLHL